MLKILERIIKGKERILNDNLAKYGISPYNVKRFWKNTGYKELYFITTTGTVVLKINRDSLDIYEFLKSSNMFINGLDQYFNVTLIKSTRKYFSQKFKYRLRIYFKDNTLVEFSNNYPIHWLKHLNNEIRALIN